MRVNATHQVRASVVPVSGALGYAWFWGAAGSEVLGAITSIASIAIQATATGTQTAASLGTSDNSVNTLAFDGLLTQALKSGSGATVIAQPQGVAGTGTPLTSDSAGGVVEIDAVLKQMWDTRRLSPDTMWVSSQEALNISRKIVAGSASTAMRFVHDTTENLVGGGIMVRTYLNRFSMQGGSTIDIKVHPNMPAGTLLMTTGVLPYARQVYADYRATFEQIASSASQQVTGLISGQETLRQAVANVLLSIIQDFVAARLKIVADWAAGVVAETAATKAGEATQTAAVVAGTAARTGAQESGAAASVAVMLVSIGKSIIASAAETFAGIFGFLSPLLGPAAVGPAAAGQATVLAVGAGLPSFDTGAWSLPFDMIAQVHKGEMIVPAGAAAELRGAMGQGGPAVQVHHQTHFNISAVDSSDIKRFFAANSCAILGAINDGVRNGAHLGLSKLGRA